MVGHSLNSRHVPVARLRRLDSPLAGPEHTGHACTRVRAPGHTVRAAGHRDARVQPLRRARSAGGWLGVVDRRAHMPVLQPPGAGTRLPLADAPDATSQSRCSVSHRPDADPALRFPAGARCAAHVSKPARLSLGSWCRAPVAEETARAARSSLEAVHASTSDQRPRGHDMTCR